MRIRRRAKSGFNKNSHRPFLLVATQRARIRRQGSLGFDIRTTLSEPQGRERPVPSRQGNAENKAFASGQVPDGAWGSEVSPRAPKRPGSDPALFPRLFFTLPVPIC